MWRRLQQVNDDNDSVVSDDTNENDAGERRGTRWGPRTASRIDPKNEHSILNFEDETASLVGALWLHNR